MLSYFVHKKTKRPEKFYHKIVKIVTRKFGVFCYSTYICDIKQIQTLLGHPPAPTAPGDQQRKKIQQQLKYSLLKTSQL